MKWFFGVTTVYAAVSLLDMFLYARYSTVLPNAVRRQYESVLVAMCFIPIVNGIWLAILFSLNYKDL